MGSTADSRAAWTGFDFKAAVQLAYPFAHSLHSHAQLDICLFKSGKAWNTCAMVLNLNSYGFRALTDPYLRGLGSRMSMKRNASCGAPIRS